MVQVSGRHVTCEVIDSHTLHVMIDERILQYATQRFLSISLVTLFSIRYIDSGDVHGVFLMIDSGQVDPPDGCTARFDRDCEELLGRILGIVDEVPYDLLVISVLVHRKELLYIGSLLPLCEQDTIIEHRFPQNKIPCFQHHTTCLKKSQNLYTIHSFYAIII